MALINLPTIAIDSAQVPRLRAALQNALGGDALNTTAEIAALTDAQLYKRWTIVQLKNLISNYEQSQAYKTAITTVAEPPDLT